jgi:hypothetical protein
MYINSPAISKKLFLLEMCKNKRIVCTFPKFDLNKWPRETHVDLSFKTMLEVWILSWAVTLQISARRGSDTNRRN